jgi:hypothetical protein
MGKEALPRVTSKSGEVGDVLLRVKLTSVSTMSIHSAHRRPTGEMRESSDIPFSLLALIWQQSPFDLRMVLGKTALPMGKEPDLQPQQS